MEAAPKAHYHRSIAVHVNVSDMKHQSLHSGLLAATTNYQGDYWDTDLGHLLSLSFDFQG